MEVNYNSEKGNVLILGGGVVGLCSAYYLLRDGWKVVLLDKGDLTNSCSNGNAGMIVPSHFTPLASPGIVSQGIRWMLNKRSPFYLKPTLDLSLASWGIKFLKHANSNHVKRSAPFIRDINLLGKQEYKVLNQENDFDFNLSEKGILTLFKLEKTAEEELHLSKNAKDLGLECSVLSASEVQLLEPEVELDVLGAVHYKCDGHINPNVFISQLVSVIKKMGGEIKTHTGVTSIEVESKKIKRVHAGSQNFKVDKVVMTGGAWLPSLAKMAGLSIPVMPGKGYSFLSTGFMGKLNYPALLLEERVAMTPIGGEVRVGGTMELAAINSKINLNRVEGIVNAVPKYYPNNPVEMPSIENIWYGFRPCSPDGLPYLGKTPSIENLVVAGGAGMMGLSTGPAMGKIVKELLNEETPSIDINMFKPQRFG